MRKSILTLFLFVVLAIPMLSQKYTVELSKELKLDKRINFKEHLHSDNSGHYILFDKNKFTRNLTPVIYKFDNQFNLSFKKEFPIKKNKRKDLGIKYFGEKFAWMFYFKDKKKKQYDVYLTSISMDGKSSTPKIIISLKYTKKDDISKIDWIVSKDTSKIILIAEYDKNSKSNVYKSYVHIIDHELNKVYDKKIITEHTQRRFESSNWNITTDGRVHFLGKVYNNDNLKESKKGNKPIYTYKLYSFGENEELKKISLDLKDHFTRGFKLISDEQSNLIGGGLFSNSPKGPILGTFYFKIKNDHSIIYKNKKKFTLSEIEDFGKKYTSIKRKTNNVGLDDTFELTDLLLHKDGSFSLVMEDNFSYTPLGILATGNNPVIYVSNFIIYTTVNAQGEQESINPIPKRQYIKDNDFINYHSTMISGDNIYFLYNDSRNNFGVKSKKPDNYKKLTNRRNAVPVLAYFENGKLFRKKLLKDKAILANKSKQISHNKIIFFNYMGLLVNGKFKIGTVTINQ